MRFTGSKWRRCVGGLAAPVLLSLTPHATAGEPLPAPAPGPALVAPDLTAPKVFDMAAARQAAVANQPAVAAARASLEAAQLKQQAVDRRLFGAALLAPDLPVRRKQACLGVTIASAALDQAVCDARQAATACYLAALYAKEQQANADRIHDRLTDLKTLAQTAVNEGRTDVGAEQIGVIDSYLESVDGRKQEAVEGYERALAALREALGMGPDCTLVIVGGRLPDVETKVDRNQIIHLALARRGEVIQTATAVEVYCLEVDAQGRIPFTPARTFAAGGDIHATALPATLHDPDYRPGPLAPEMPTTLPGNRADRQQEAEAYHTRAAAVADKTRNLAVLQAEDAYLRWRQYDDEEPKLQSAAQKLEASSKDLSQRFNPHKAVGYPTINDLTGLGLKATQMRLDATQIKFRRLAALADLERVTGGGFDSGLDAPAVPSDKTNP